MDEHYFKEETGIPVKLGIVKAWIKNTEFSFYTSPPVFSWRKVDKGTMVLAENMVIPETASSLLDLGCGYGVIGIVAAFFNPNLKIVMIDSSKRAIFLAKKNVEKYNLKEQVEIIQGNLYEPLKTETEEVRKFDVIVSNPPYSAGKEIVAGIISKAPLYLKKNGLLEIVGRHSKGGKMYKEEMLKVFSSVEELGKSGGFRVYVGSTKSSP